MTVAPIGWTDVATGIKTCWVQPPTRQPITEKRPHHDSLMPHDPNTCLFPLEYVGASFDYLAPPCHTTFRNWSISVAQHGLSMCLHMNWMHYLITVIRGWSVRVFGTLVSVAKKCTPLIFRSEVEWIWGLMHPMLRCFPLLLSNKKLNFRFRILGTSKSAFICSTA